MTDRALTPPAAGSLVSSSSTLVTPADVLAGTAPGTKTHKRLGWFFWACVGWIALNILLAIGASILPLPNPIIGDTNHINAGPGAGHILGTDDLGRDILSRLIYGARISLGIGFGAIGIGLALGGTLGMIAGYRRGLTDSILNSASYVLLAFPALIAIIAVVAFWGQTFFKITLIIGIVSAPLLFRVIRASTLSYSTREFVTAARAIGATDRRILTREIFPNILPALLSFSLIGVATVIITEGSLAFLGLSVLAPTASWGNMINEGRSTYQLQHNPWLELFPELAIFLFLIALNFVGDRLRQHFDVSELRL